MTWRKSWARNWEEVKFCSERCRRLAKMAVRASGEELRAPQAGYIVFPDVGAQPGHEWFYLAGKSDRPL